MFKKLYIASLFLLTYFQMIAQPGQLDSSFGKDGILNASTAAYITAELQKDNKILIGGYGLNEYDQNFSLLRLFSDGSIDKSFGEKGYVLNYFDGYFTQVSGVQVLTNGNIITAASGFQEDRGTTDILLARYKPNGTLDSSFGIDGKVVKDFGYFEYVYGVQVQKDGKILVLGSSLVYPENQETVIFVDRFNADGSVDESFGDKGQMFLTGLPSYPAGIAVQSDGKIIVGGRSSSSFPFVYLARLNSDGSYDESFGLNGVVEYDVPGSPREFIKTVSVADDGKIITAGAGDFVSTTKNTKMMINHFNSDGSIDKTFGTNGTTFIKFPFCGEASGISMQSNKKIVIAGRHFNDLVKPAFGDFATVRLTADGVIDSSFGENGITITDFGGYDLAGAALLQSDGKIVSVGNGPVGYAAARYYGDPVKQTGPIAKKIRRWIRNHTLQWQPVNDNDVAYYSIQQSSNGVNGFKEIGRIANVNRQSANVNNVCSFSLNNTSSSSIQNSTSNTNYYRITAVSNDGSNITSDVIADENVSSITISPNPVKDVMKITGLPASQKSTINIVNSNGNVLQSSICNSSVCNMNVSPLKSGLYNVQVISNGKTQTLQFIKQ